MVAFQPNLNELRANPYETAPKRRGDSLRLRRRGEMEAHTSGAPPAAGGGEIFIFSRAGAIRGGRTKREISLLKEVAEETSVNLRIFRANSPHDA